MLKMTVKCKKTGKIYVDHKITLDNPGETAEQFLARIHWGKEFILLDNNLEPVKPESQATPVEKRGEAIAQAMNKMEEALEPCVKQDKAGRPELDYRREQRELASRDRATVEVEGGLPGLKGWVIAGGGEESVTWQETL